MNLLSSAKRIASACTNIGEATVIRIRPEIATREHSYFEALRAGGDEKYNKAYIRAHEEYFRMLPDESREAMVSKGHRPSRAAAGTPDPEDILQV